jgi:enoyl-CoA hydratase/carnithine racemase
LAGACELVQICDIKIASDRAVLGEPEIRAGVGPPLLITPFSIGLARSKELLLTGDTIDAHEAARLGTVNRALEGMGFLSAISNNLELMIHFDISSEPEQDEFNKISDKQGLKAALNWRDGRFKDL